MTHPAHDEETLDAGDSEMGPGVDLTISLLAMVLLVLVMLKLSLPVPPLRVVPEPGKVLLTLKVSPLLEPFSGMPRLKLPPMAL